MSDFHARTATLDDRETLLDLMTDFNRLEGVAWTREGCAAPLATLLASAHLGAVGLFVEGDAVRGYFVLPWGYDLEWAGRDSFLTELYLRPEARGRELGRAVMGAACVVASAVVGGASLVAASAAAQP